MSLFCEEYTESPTEKEVGARKAMSLKKVRTILLVLLFMLGFFMLNIAQADMSYSLGSELKKSNCIGDTDNDCLDNVQENNLAWILAPHYFYDEDESCARGNDRRQDFFQVRPHGVNISGWAPTDGLIKFVNVTFFFLFPRDCQNYLGFGGHNGDPEKVQYTLYSFDLKTWYLLKGRYWHHKSPYHDFSGVYLQQRANEIGSFYPSVAADEDGHGSWPGKHGDSDHCAGAEDPNFFGTNDCFVSTMKADYLANRWTWAWQPRNIGGPWPESWDTSTLTVIGKDAYTDLNVGHGLNREYWSYKPGYYKFCGWQCSSRDSSGNCLYNFFGWEIHSECTSPLHAKVDDSYFCLFPASDSRCQNYWTPQFSEEAVSGISSVICLTGYAIAGLECSGRYCDNKKVLCSPLRFNRVSNRKLWWIGPISEERPNNRVWGGNRVISGMKCQGRYCDNLSLTLDEFEQPMVVSCRALGPVSEEQGRLVCPADHFLSGLQCSGRYCDNLTLNCCRFE